MFVYPLYPPRTGEAVITGVGKGDSGSSNLDKSSGGSLRKIDGRFTYHAALAHRERSDNGQGCRGESRFLWQDLKKIRHPGLT